MNVLAAALASGLLVGAAVWLACDAGVLRRGRALSRRWKAFAMARRKAGGSFSAHGGLERLAESVLGALGPLRVWVRRYREDRERAALRARCLDELPELIDVVALGLSAGVSFDAALAIYCERYRTGLAARFAEAMQSWRLGVSSRRDALRALSGRLGVPALTTFCETVTESLDFGAPLAKTLVDQAEAVRRARRFAVEEQIEKAPVKMLVPTGVLVLPAMLLAILGPLLSALSTTTG